MWRTTRYEMVLHAYPPHDATAILPAMIRLLDDTAGQHLVWHLEGQPARPAPASKEEWVALTNEWRNPTFGALDLFFETSTDLTMSLSVDAPSFVRDFNVMSFGLDAEHLVGRKALFSFDSLYALFVESIRLFQPFSAEVGDREIVRKDAAGKLYLSVDVTKVPTIVHWFNYFGNGMVERLGGRGKLLGAPAYLVKETGDPPGMVLVLQREPFDYHNEMDRRRWLEITRYLNLKRLHARYRRRE